MLIEVGSQAPDFTLKDQNNQEITLADFRSRKAVLLVFYPLAFTGTCQGELAEIQESHSQYSNDYVQILTISVDSVYSHKIWADREGYTFPLLSDFWPHGGVAQAYGTFNEQAGFANRGTIIIDRDGVVRFAQLQGPGEPRNQDTWRTAVKDLIH